MLLRKGVLKICNKFTGEHPCRSVISIKLLCIFIKITLRHGCFLVNLLYIFRKPFLKNTLDGCLCNYKNSFEAYGSLLFVFNDIDELETVCVSLESERCEITQPYLVNIETWYIE